MRAAIVGTAQSWKQTPWDDPGLRIIGLNDAYSLGFKRADEWWELHPLDKMFFRPRKQKMVFKDQIPPGHYVRPEGHLEWLKEQARTIPVWLQQEPPEGWGPNAKRFPIEEMEAKYGTYWASGPAYELMSLYDRGYKEIHVYGIHLSTEHEYREQRPNFEMLLGRLIGAEVREERRGDLRYYHGKDCTIVLPVSSPILQHGWKYAYEPKPVAKASPHDAEWKAIQHEKQDLVRALVNWPKGKDKSAALERLKRIEIIEMDIQQQMAKRQMSGTLTAIVPELVGV
jgi:hypothetical protein